MLTIRDADPDRDGPGCAAIYAPFVRDTWVTFDEDPPHGAAMSERIAATLVTHPWIVAEDDGRVAGYAHASRHRERPAYRWAAEVGIYIAAEHRGKGVGRTLYGALLGLLREQGIHVALAGVTVPNPASEALHRACGFTHLGTYVGVGWKQGAWRDVSWWQLRIGDDREPGRVRPPVRLAGWSGPPAGTG